MTTIFIDKVFRLNKISSMGERNKFTEAIILNIREQGENNRSVCAMSPDMGIFYGTLYGGPKSKLKSLVQPFNYGTIFIYEDENRHLRKISDFDVKNFHTALKENLYKIWAANLASEILIKTKCAGDDRSSFVLLKAFMDGIDSTDENGARIGTIRFLWRYLSLLGVQPEVTECSGCGRKLFSENPSEELSSHFIPATSGMVCRECGQSYEKSRDSGIGFFSVTEQALHYLDAISNLTPGQVRRLTLSQNSMDSLKRLLFHLIEAAVGSPLMSLKSGFGIL